MKKIISLVLALCMLLALAACSKTETPTDDTGKEAAPAVKVIDIAITEEEYAFGVSKDDAELLKQLNEYIAEIKSNGTFEEISNKYFGDGTPEGFTSAKEDSSKDQLVVVTNAEFAPFEYLEGENYFGVDMEIMKGFADSLGKELVIKNTDFDSVLQNVDNGYADIAAAGLTKNADREKFVTFTDSYYNASQMVITKGSDTTFDNCKTAEDVAKILDDFDASVIIGAQNSTTGKAYIDGDESFEFKGLTATGKGYSNGALAVQDLINGNIQYVIIDEAPAKAISEKFNSQMG